MYKLFKSKKDKMRKTILSADIILKNKQRKRRKKCIYIAFAIIIVVAVLMCTVASVK